MLKNRILNTLSTTLPDDRPITAIQIVEYVEKCPRGFLVISKTHDQDQDADLWRDSSFLKRNKSGRYLCLSKSEGIPSFVVQDITIVNEKSLPPEGYSLLYRTADTEQKAWRKRQLCYKLANTKTLRQAVTDIIVCNRLKKAPDGFTLAGEINGMTICYKMGNVQDTANNCSGPHPLSQPEFGKPVSPSQPNYPKIPDGDDHDYEIISMAPNPNITPTRPAPMRPAPTPPGPPLPVSTNNTHANSYTLGTYAALEGVPFILNPRLTGSNSNNTNSIPIIRARTLSQIDKDFSYDFQTERHS